MWRETLIFAIAFKVDLGYTFSIGSPGEDFLFDLCPMDDGRGRLTVFP